MSALGQKRTSPITSSEADRLILPPAHFQTPLGPYEFSKTSCCLLSFDAGALSLVQLNFRCVGVIWPTPGRKNIRNTMSMKLRASKFPLKWKGRSGLERFRRE